MSDWSTALGTVLRVAAFVALGYLTLLFLLQRSVMYPGARRASPRPTADVVPAGARQLWVDTGAERIEAWLLEARGSRPAPTLLFLHGNGELIEDWPGRMRAFTERGVHVLLVELPGYGHSRGRPSRSALRRTARAAFDTLAGLPAVDPGRVVPMGRSLGGAAAADLTLDRPAPALVLLSTFSSAAAMAWEGFRFPPWLVRDRFDAEGAVGAFPGPVLVLHGREDDLVPLEHARRIERAGERGRVEVVELACGHNDCLAVWPTIVRTVTEFLAGHDLLDEAGTGA